ncbi:MAG: ABC transporter substrate-binding protein [Bacteroidota bacterium]
MKKSCLVGVLAIAVILLSSIGPMAAPVTIEVWHKWNPGEPVGEWLTKATAAFEKANPDIKVNLLGQGRQLINKVRPRFIEGNPPDIIETYFPNVYKLYKEGLLAELDGYMNTRAEGKIVAKWKDTFIPQVYTGQMIGGKMYMVPIFYDTSSFFYNVSIFKKYKINVPKTWNDFLKACETLKKNGVEPIAVDGGNSAYNGWWFVQTSTRLLGADYVRDTALNKPGTSWTNPGYLDAAKKVQYVAQNYFMKGFQGSAFPAAQIDWATSKTAMMFNASWLPNEMRNTLPADYQMGEFLFPQIPGGKGDQTVVELWSNGYAIPKDAKHKDEAAQYLKFITSREMAADMLKHTDVLSSIKGTPVPVRLKDVPRLIANAKSTTDLRSGITTMAPEWEIQVFQPLNDKLLFGTITPEEFIEKLDAAHKRFYEKK